jgi:hypothetical protein
MAFVHDDEVADKPCANALEQQGRHGALGLPEAI